MASQGDWGITSPGFKLFPEIHLFFYFSHRLPSSYPRPFPRAASKICMMIHLFAVLQSQYGQVIFDMNTVSRHTDLTKIHSVQIQVGHMAVPIFLQRQGKSKVLGVYVTANMDNQLV